MMEKKIFGICCTLLMSISFFGQQGITLHTLSGVNSDRDDIVCTVWENHLLFSTNNTQDLVSDYQWNEHYIFQLRAAKRGTLYKEYGSAQPLFPFFATRDEGPASYDLTDSTLYFSSAENYDRGTGTKLKLYKVKWMGNMWGWPELLPFVNNNAEYAHPYFDPQMNLLVFSSNRGGGSGNMDIWYTYKVKEGWTDPVNPGYLVNSSGNEIFPSVHDGQIYYASDGLVQGVGYDLFYAQKRDQWQTSVQLQAPLNSPYNDVHIIYLNHSKGYITTDRPGGKGGDDIYLFEQMKFPQSKDRIFSLLLEYKGEPLPNAHVIIKDELGDEVVNADMGNDALVAIPEIELNRKYRLGIQKIDPSLFKECVVYVIDVNGNRVKELRLNQMGWCDLELLDFDYTDLVVYPNIDKSILTVSFNGRVYQEQPGDIGVGEMIQIEDESGQLVAIAYTNDQGNFEFSNLFPELKYIFRLSNKSKATQVVVTDRGKNITLPILKEEAIYQRLKKEEAIQLVNEVNETVYISREDLFVINRVYYQSNSSQLSSEAQEQLDQLVLLMKLNPSMHVELRSHTDTRGEARKNLELSEQRAEMVKRYLVQHGINTNRITAIGMGESQPVNKCEDVVNCSDAEHAINRRTEIKLFEVK